MKTIPGKAIHRGGRGTAAIEFGIGIAFLALLVTGIVEVGYSMYQATQVTYAAEAWPVLCGAERLERERYPKRSHQRHRAFGHDRDGGTILRMSQCFGHYHRVLQRHMHKRR